MDNELDELETVKLERDIAINQLQGWITINKDYTIELCKHAIGMGLRNPYKRHGRMFYRPYRNYFSTSFGCDDYKHWEELEVAGYAKSVQRKEYGRTFWLTRSGLD